MTNYFDPYHSFVDLIKSKKFFFLLTVVNRHGLSLIAPQYPRKLNRNIKAPHTINT